MVTAVLVIVSCIVIPACGTLLPFGDAHRTRLYYLTISGFLDDHYGSSSDYHLSVSINGVQVFYSQRAPFLHGKPYGQRLNNWRSFILVVPRHLITDKRLEITLKHTGSDLSDWIGLDYLELEGNGQRIKKELNEYKNYGYVDRAADIIYAERSKTWII